MEFIPTISNKNWLPFTEKTHYNNISEYNTFYRNDISLIKYGLHYPFTDNRPTDYLELHLIYLREDTKEYILVVIDKVYDKDMRIINKLLKEWDYGKRFWF